MQGHEIGGVVATVGANVTHVKVGDKITFMPQVTCGECYPCKHGMYHICESLKVMGFQTRVQLRNTSRCQPTKSSSSPTAYHTIEAVRGEYLKVMIEL